MTALAVAGPWQACFKAVEDRHGRMHHTRSTAHQRSTEKPGLARFLRSRVVERDLARDRPSRDLAADVAVERSCEQEGSAVVIHRLCPVHRHGVCGWRIAGVVGDEVSEELADFIVREPRSHWFGGGASAASGYREEFIIGGEEIPERPSLIRAGERELANMGADRFEGERIR